MFKRQTFMSQNTGVLTSVGVGNLHTPVRPHEWIDCCDRFIGPQNNMASRSFLINNTFSTMNKLLTPNMYCWSRKTLVTVLWMHLRLSGICTKSFCQQRFNSL